MATLAGCNSYHSAKLLNPFDKSLRGIKRLSFGAHNCAQPCDSDEQAHMCAANYSHFRLSSIHHQHLHLDCGYKFVVNMPVLQA